MRSTRAILRSTLALATLAGAACSSGQDEHPIGVHSGQADTIDQAIRLHAGTASSARDAYLALPREMREALLVFLRTL